MAAAMPGEAPSMSSAARDRLSPMVEQAPYSPSKGIWKLRRPKEVPMHWFSRSPAST